MCYPIAKEDIFDREEENLPPKTTQSSLAPTVRNRIKSMQTTARRHRIYRNEDRSTFNTVSLRIFISK
jgi:hypothetical protein